jgi:outer membrane receptor protein involved in Fe transport
VNPLNNSQAFEPLTIGLEQVEVYTSGFSAEYGNAQSGVVNMVTKEGTSKWQSRMEVSVTLPYYKTWQESPYDPGNLYFYDSLSVLTEWLKENPTQPGKPLYDAGYGFGPRYLRSPLYGGWPPPGQERLYQDSLEVAYLGQVLWYQAVRDIGLEYNNTMDYRLDFTTGGPLGDKTYIFLAARQNTINPIVPMPDPDLERQMMLNISYRPFDGDKFKFSFIYDNNTNSYLGDFRRYLFDRTLNAKFNDDRSLQLITEWEHVFNNSTFSEVILSLLDLHQKTRLDLMESGIFIEDYRNTNWTDYTMPSYYRVGRPEDDQGDQRTQTYNLKANLSKQINEHNLLKSGIQFTYYDIAVDMDAGMSTEGSYRQIKFNKYPFEGALYFQDKMEFSGLIANIGLRFDFYQLNTSYFNDTFSPLRSPDDKSETKLYTRLQPRIGISFPVSSTSVFHLNYGTFTQRPNFNQLFFNQITAYNDIDVLGNPKLKPEVTNSYDIGIVQGLPFGLRLDVSAYYKDVKDLVQSAYYKNKNQEVYRTYTNRDYADIKGFHVSFEKIVGKWQGYLRYNFESATGKSSNALNAPVTYFENPDPVYGASQVPDPEDVYLDYDRKHKLIFNIRYRTGRETGPEIFGIKPLADISISSTLRNISGRPYTFDISGQGLKFNKRTPTEREWRMRIQKRLRFSEALMTAYVEGFNLLNEMFYHYSRTFDDERETARWHYERDNILVYDEYNPYTTSQAIYLLRNEPRHFRVGVIYNF